MKVLRGGEYGGFIIFRPTISIREVTTMVTKDRKVDYPFLLSSESSRDEAMPRLYKVLAIQAL